MKYSKLFGKATFDSSKDSKFASYNLLIKGGFIRESSAGRFFFLPLGWRVHDKMKAIIKEEMDATGAQEMLVPTLHPLGLWEETNRTNSVGFELMKIKDRNGAEFALGGTAEEMFVDVVRKLHLSHKDLPINLYQFSNKFRDEFRARGGLLRVREFIMKDAYSFHTNEEDFLKEYEVMAAAYKRMYQRMGLEALQVAADNGYIGGEYCHEYQVESELGEGRFFVSEDGKYSAHEDIAEFECEEKNSNEELLEYEEVDAIRGTTMEDGVKFHHLPLWQQIKDVLFATESGELVLAIIRGDLDVNEIKLAHAIGAHTLRHATEEEVRTLDTEPGFISPVGLSGKVKIIGDTSLRTVVNAYGGANVLHRDALNINIDRDYQLDLETDIAMAQPGFKTRDGTSTLVEKRGIEVGNIFQLGYHYSKKMKDATFTSESGEQLPFYMGCYGFGIGRTLATVVEKHHDDRGILWPASIAPYQVHLISLQGGEEQAAVVYNKLQTAGIEVLWDEREESAGVKFADADLLGIPTRLIVSKKTGNQVEWKARTDEKSELISLDECLNRCGNS
ncbi:MAG: proline--tRNA ligase [Candidatus Pacebacteria bacterium]|nr:proline--tRNA ligase [Candidatus Paceibacterota bacterium]PIR59723.1 MAG: proline--tRNA ligase [Candidatus Pacebacteria bacterium CG10_big_fil_rev_8_21_14_0_10_45_6]